MDTALNRRQADRAGYLDYRRAAKNLRTFEATFAALAADVQRDPALVTFAQPFADGLRRRYEELQAWCAEVAAQAETVRDDFRSHLDLDDEHREVGGWVGVGDYGVECSCGTTFTAPTSDLLNEVADRHFGDVA